MMRRPCTSSILTVGLLIGLLAPSQAGAQASKSSVLAKELVAALDSRKLGAIATRVAGADDRYAAALYFSGSQLLVISARYTPPEILNERLAKKEYREVYMDLNQASLPASRMSIEDFGADGLVSRKGGGPADTFEQAGSKLVAFDGDWAKQQMTEDAYQKALASADDQYTQILTALLAEAKKGS